jgi:co-chaperonin GroES (HSP10)
MSGVTLDQPCEILPAGTKLRLLRDRILVRPLDWEPSKIISVVRQGRPLRGEIVAVGPGRFYRRYKRHPTNPQMRQYTESKHFIRCEVQVGDVVEFGGLNVFDGLGYSFPQVMIGTERFLIAQEQDVAFVHEKPAEGAAVEPHGEMLL